MSEEKNGAITFLSGDSNSSQVYRPKENSGTLKKNRVKEYTQREFLSLFNEYNQWLKSGYKNLGRNDICACGSGKKYKKCCLGVFQNSEFMKFEKLCHDIMFISLYGDVKNITEEIMVDYFNHCAVKEVKRNDFGQIVEVLKILF
jgi:hypothetical protein